MTTKQVSFRRLLLTTALTLSGLVRLPAADLQFKLHPINTNSTFEACAVMDINHDGKLDIFCGGFWYEAPDWKQHWVRDVEKLGNPPDYDGYSALEMDVNRDGWMDVVVVNWRSSSIYWLENPGPPFGEWKKHMIATPGNMETGRLFDIAGEGHQDLLPDGSQFAAWWELMPPKPGVEPEWVRHNLPREVAGHGVGFGDINGDGRGDIIGPRGWLEAPVDRRNGQWIWHPEFNLVQASIPIIVADVNGDGLNDIIWSIGHGYGVHWLEQTKVDGKRGWTDHLIDESWSVGHAPMWVDMDKDGIPEYVVGKRYRAHGLTDPGALDPLVIFRYQYDKAAGKFQRYTIENNGPVGGGLDPRAVDLDGDGDLDLVFPGRSGLYWYENLLITNKVQTLR